MTRFAADDRAYRMAMHWLFIGVLIVVVLSLAACTVHLILTWAERRGWIYYRGPDKPRSAPLGLLEEIYQPSMTHVIEERAEEEARADQAESGEPEDT